MVDNYYGAPIYKVWIIIKYCNMLNWCKSLVLCDILVNELHRIDLITGVPHGINSSLLTLLGVCLYMGRIYVLLNFIKEKFYSVNHWFCMIYMGMNYFNYRGTSWHKSLLIKFVWCVPVHGEDSHTLFKTNWTGFYSYYWKYVNHSHV